MRSEVFEPRGANGIAILSGNHEGRELDDVGWPQAMSGEEGDDVGEHLVGLLGDRRRSGAIGANTDLAGDEQQLGSSRDSDRVAVQTEWRVNAGGIVEA